MAKIHRIYTEDVHRRAMIRMVAEKFNSFTLQPITGYYRGKRENSIVLEVAGAKESQIKWLAEQIRRINRQASVLIITLNGQTKKITANNSLADH